MMVMKKNQKLNMLYVFCLYLFQIVLLQCFRNKSPEVRQKEAISMLFKKFLDNLTSWVHVAKVYTILHVALQDQGLMREISFEILDRQNLLYFYTKRPDSRDYSIFL